MAACFVQLVSEHATMTERNTNQNQDLYRSTCISPVFTKAMNPQGNVISTTSLAQNAL